MPPPGPHIHRCQDDPPSNPASVPAPATNPSNAHGTDDVTTGPPSTLPYDEAANPFCASGPQPDTPSWNRSLLTSTESMVTPSILSQSSGHPRAGCHSTICRRPLASGPAGNKHRHAANDIWTFFTKIEDKNNCVFCK
jgi:hypothetical protein